MLLQHFAVAAAHAVKVYGQYGVIMKQYETACKVINHGLIINILVVPNLKLGSQRYVWYSVICYKPR